MPRLFVAVELPSAATARLSALQPQAAQGVRLAAPCQMHLTLHYLGEADIERMSTALEKVASPAFSIDFQGVGQFPSAGGAVTLWAGVRESPELLGLHAAVAAALAGEGFRPEARRYTPHVTLARCGPEVSEGVVDEFLARHKGISPPPVPVAEFGLYSSGFVGDVPVYQRERSFTLRVIGSVAGEAFGPV